MNEKFLQLCDEKRFAILNAAMEVFGKHEYKHAISDDIAAKAGVSKGLLFYYFHNKQELYLYVFNYCNEVLKKMIVDEHFFELDDFFEIMEYGANKKVSLLRQYPFLTDFVIRAYYSANETVSDNAAHYAQDAIGEGFSLYFSNIDMHKFKDGIDPKYIYQMLLLVLCGWLSARTTSMHGEY